MKPTIYLLESTLAHSAGLARLLDHSIPVQSGKSLDNAKLDALAQQAKDIEAALMTMTESSDTDELPEKLRHWGRKMLDLSLRNPLLNMRTGRSAIKLDRDDIALMEDHLDDGEELLLEQRELKGIYRTVRTEIEETGVRTLFLVLGTVRWGEQKGGKE